MLTRLLRRIGGGGEEASQALSYETQREMVQNPDPQVRLQLAQDESTRPEILYFLAADDAPEVRRAIASNQATPLQADLLLTDDTVDDVRADLALKIGRLIPDMPSEEQQRVREMTIETLETPGAGSAAPGARGPVGRNQTHPQCAAQGGEAAGP